MSEQLHQDQLYKIGAVSKFTNITVECLRAWERRYGLTPAQRAGKTRYYSKDQVERLGKIKTLLDQGHPISQLIKLPEAEIDRRLRADARVDRPSAAPTVALVGVDLILAEREQTEQSLDIRARWPNIEAFERELEFAPAVSTIVVLTPSLDPAVIDRLTTRLASSRIVWAYRFATQGDMEAAQSAAATVVQWPSAWREIEKLCIAANTAVGRADQRSPSRYSDEELLHISAAARGTACECAYHLSDLVMQINAFAAHTERCGSQSRTVQPHDDIVRDAERARAQLEAALAALVDDNGLLIEAEKVAG